MSEYIAAFSPEVRSILERIRVTIMKAAPDAEEKIIYQLPTFTLKGAEPWFLAFNASIEIHPVMIPDNLAKAGAPSRTRSRNTPDRSRAN